MDEYTKKRTNQLKQFAEFHSRGDILKSYIGLFGQAVNLLYTQTNPSRDAVLAKSLRGLLDFFGHGFRF